MTQIDASPTPAGKTAAKADAGARGKGGQADGDAGLEGGKPRFGDHWRSILSGDAGKPGKQPASPDEEDVVGDKAPSKRFGVLFRLPPVALAQAKDAANDHVAALGTDVPNQGEIDISEALAALKNAGADAGDAPAYSAGEVALGTHAENASAYAIASGVVVDAGEASAVRPADMQAGEIAVEQAARGAAVHPAMANAAAQSAAAGTIEPSPPADAKARARGAMANAPLDKGSSDTTSDIHLATRADAARPAMKATVVHQATHFAP
ncbi:MAG TPA: hypothetical protein VLQ65_12785, partial [Saliniramus sp.]|nr:hypothetical protein [Saliniramus sp.]